MLGSLLFNLKKKPLLRLVLLRLIMRKKSQIPLVMMKFIKEF
jgi:hypothetical protein